MTNANDSKSRLLILLQRLVPGTIDIQRCDDLEYCMDNKSRSCKIANENVCIMCRGEDGIIGGISFLFDAMDNMGSKNGIMIHRYGQADSYVTMIEGNGINDILGKLEKDEVIKEIEEKTEFINKERKDAKNLEIIKAFKRKVDEKIDDTPIILVTRKNKDGEYEELDKELIKIAKEKIDSGKEIKIVDESEIAPRFYLLGIRSKKVVKKIDAELNAIQAADNRLHMFVLPVKDEKGKYHGILAISSIEDDLVGENDIKDKWKKHFTEKYTGIDFIDIWESKGNKDNKDIQS